LTQGLISLLSQEQSRLAKNAQSSSEITNRKLISQDQQQQEQPIAKTPLLILVVGSQKTA